MNRYDSNLLEFIHNKKVDSQLYGYSQILVSAVTRSNYKSQAGLLDENWGTKLAVSQLLSWEGVEYGVENRHYMDHHGHWTIHLLQETIDLKQDYQFQIVVNILLLVN